MQDLPQQGSIADTFFPRLVSRLHLEGFEGAVRVSLGPTTKVIYFKRGEIASAASNAESDRLANILIAAERLSQAQLDMAKSRLQPGGSLGKTLIEMGFLSPNELLLGARQQVREILGSCFALSRGDYQVEPGALPREVTVLGLQTKRLIFDSLLQLKDRQSVIREMGSMESTYGPTGDLTPGLNALRLDVEMDRIGRMLDGLSTLREISGRTSLDDFTVSKVVLALDLLGLADRVGTEAASPAPASGGRSIPIAVEDPAAEPEPALAGASEPEFGTQEDEAAPGTEILPAAQQAEGDSGASIGEADGAPPSEDATPADEPPAPAGYDRSDPPPIPREELPPFAFQPGDEPQWTIDPRTGERVHEGPVEMTFDGTISSRSGSRRRLGGILALAGGLALVLTVSFFYFHLRRVSGATSAAGIDGTPGAGASGAAAAAPLPGPTPPAAPATPGEGQTAAMTEDGPATATAPPEHAAAPAAALATTPPAVATTPPAAPAPAAPAAPSETIPRPAPAPAGPARSQPPPGPPPHGSISPFGDSTRYLAALRAFDTGDPVRAAQIFRDLVASEDPSRYTLQLMIACEVDTLKTARADSGERGSLYFLPYSLKGRDCYRACWGAYPGKGEAAAAIATLPEAFTRSGSPVAVPLARLRRHAP